MCDARLRIGDPAPNDRLTKLAESIAKCLEGDEHAGIEFVIPDETPLKRNDEK